MSTDMQERVDRLDAMIAEGRVLRGQWTDGRERACLLAALSPEAGKAEHANACPAHVMPAWLAYMTPWIDDDVSAEAWPGVIRRYASLARRWHRLGDAAWERARARIASHIDAARSFSGTRAASYAESAPHALLRASAIRLDRAASWAVAAASDGRSRAAEAARLAVADRIATAVLDAIEAEIERSEKA